jgi:hypothetical protein
VLVSDLAARKAWKGYAARDLEGRARGGHPVLARQLAPRSRSTVSRPARSSHRHPCRNRPFSSWQRFRSAGRERPRNRRRGRLPVRRSRVRDGTGSNSRRRPQSSLGARTNASGRAGACITALVLNVQDARWRTARAACIPPDRRLAAPSNSPTN